MNNKILVTRSSMPPFEEYIDEIRELWDSRWLTNMGVKHFELQKKLEQYLEVKHIVLYTNGHLALENIIQIFNFKKESEVITTPYTFASTTHAIYRNGLIPIFCDIKFDDLTIDENKIENLITDKTVAIIPVHVYGNICDYKKIDSIAKKYNLKVIYDAAHSFGVRKDGVSIANFGDASMYSFHATKVFHTIEGGAVAFNDDSFTQVLNDNKNFGIRSETEVKYIGGNAKMNEFQASMGLCNLRHLNEEINKRKLIYERYVANLKNVEGIKLNYYEKSVEPNYAYFPVIFDGYKYNRNEIFDKLARNGIMTRKYFYPITNSFECYKDLKTADVSLTPIAFEVSNKVLTLPIYADLSLDVVDKICNVILE